MRNHQPNKFLLPEKIANLVLPILEKAQNRNDTFMKIAREVCVKATEPTLIAKKFKCNVSYIYRVKNEIQKCLIDALFFQPFNDLIAPLSNHTLKIEIVECANKTERNNVRKKNVEKLRQAIFN